MNMGTVISEIIKKIEESYPISLALDWDNPGLICGHFDREVDTVLIALDPDDTNINKAIAHGAGLIISHHPLIFSAVKKINDKEAHGKKILKLIENGVASYAMHTNFDIAHDGMGDSVAKRLGIINTHPLETTYQDENGEAGIGFVGELNLGNGLSAKELAKEIKNTFGLSYTWYYDAGKPIKKIAVCPGSGKSMFKQVLISGADAFITGDTGHHDGLDLKDAGITLIDAGHYGLEHIFMDEMTEFMKKHFPELTLIRGAEDERKFV